MEVRASPTPPQGSCSASAELEGWWEAPLCTLADVGLVAVVSMAVIVVAGTPSDCRTEEAVLSLTSSLLVSLKDML